MTQSRLWDEWLDGILEGDKPTVESFTRSAFSADPIRLIETPVRKLDPSKWGFCLGCNHLVGKCRCDMEDAR
jgi:hypothetical protein